jgi:hypothetical protein
MTRFSRLHAERRFRAHQGSFRGRLPHPRTGHPFSLFDSGEDRASHAPAAPLSCPGLRMRAVSGRSPGPTLSSGNSRCPRAPRLAPLGDQYATVDSEKRRRDDEKKFHLPSPDPADPRPVHISAFRGVPKAAQYQWNIDPQLALTSSMRARVKRPFARASPAVRRARRCSAQHRALLADRCLAGRRL